jgi:hypothetical protein
VSMGINRPLWSVAQNLNTAGDPYFGLGGPAPVPSENTSINADDYISEQFDAARPDFLEFAGLDLAFSPPIGKIKLFDPLIDVLRINVGSWIDSAAAGIRTSVADKLPVPNVTDPKLGNLVNDEAVGNPNAVGPQFIRASFQSLRDGLNYSRTALGLDGIATRHAQGINDAANAMDYPFTTPDEAREAYASGFIYGPDALDRVVGPLGESLALAQGVQGLWRLGSVGIMGGGTSGIGPVRQGAAGVERAIADLEASGGRVLGREITVEAGGVRTRPDLFAELPNGQQAFLEIKTGPSAGLTPNQTKAFPQISTQGGIPRGANAAGAGLTPGTAIGPTPVWTIHYPWPLLP